MISESIRRIVTGGTTHRSIDRQSSIKKESPSERHFQRRNRIVLRDPPAPDALINSGGQLKKLCTRLASSIRMAARLLAGKGHYHHKGNKRHCPHKTRWPSRKAAQNLHLIFSAGEGFLAMTTRIKPENQNSFEPLNQQECGYRNEFVTAE